MKDVGLAETLRSRLRLPLIAAPMFRASGPELVRAACAAGIIGAFPTANARTVDELDEWLARLDGAVAPGQAPYAVNLIIRQKRLGDDLACLERHQVEVVITSVGSPEPVLDRLHALGAVVLADVATLRHARRAVELGADGLVLLSAGAGGQTGWANPFAFVRAVRRFFDGPVVLAGGISDGRALRAAEVLGCDLAYMGTRFIAAHESMASPEYKRMLVDCGLDDIVLTRAFTGLPTSMLAPAIRAAGLDPGRLDEGATPEEATQVYGGPGPGLTPGHWVDTWSAGHSVSGVDAVESVADIVDRVSKEFEEAGGVVAAGPSGPG
ncbi:MAG TPA: nitronate monooxygenase [Acidimicrobiia bacterium]|nr:nitronate monooxygenase [Acidimicrobiia bacterium]